MADDPSDTYLTTDTPDLTPSLRANRPAVRDASHAHDIVTSLFDDNDARVEEAAKLRDKSDGITPPIDPQKLAEEGKSHKRNFSTGFLGSLIERIIPRLVMRVKSSRYLTASSLPPDVPKAAEKTELFRRVVTDTIRNWPEWNFFLYNLADNDVKFGKGFVAYEEKDEWRPSIYRIDDCAIPDGTRQGAAPDYFGIRREYSVSELFEIISDRNAAEDAGWDVDNVVESINNARPSRDEKEGTQSEEAITYQDIELELVKHESFTKDWNNIKIEILYATEYDGTVSLWIIDGESEEELFSSESLYDTMHDVIEPVCFDIGNGTVYGSMGVGQKLYDIALNLEKARNQSFDQLANRGKIFLHVADASAMNDVETVVTDEYIYIGNAKIVNSEAALPNNAEAFLALDRYTRNLAEEKAGAVLPESQGSDKSATQSTIDALKERETTDAKLDFWLTYMSRVISMMQRRMMDPESTDADARLAQARCLKGMSAEELQILAHQSPAPTGIDYTEAKQAQQLAFLQSRVGNPKWNQDKLEETIASMTIGSELTDALMLEGGEQTTIIEATRTQQDETLSVLSRGISVPVSPRDEHVIHMQSLSGAKSPEGDRWDGQIFAMLAEGNVRGAASAFEHYQQHYAIAEQQEVLGEYQNVAKSFMSDAQRSIQEAIKMEQEFAQQQAQIDNQ